MTWLRRWARLLASVECRAHATEQGREALAWWAVHLKGGG